MLSAFLFKDADFKLNQGEHIGIVGENGAGKSTFIKICTKQLVPDTGRVVWQPGTKIGYLDQYAQIEKQTTIKAFLKSAFSRMYEIEKKMNELYSQAADGDMNKLNMTARYQEELEREDFYLIDTKIEQAAMGLGLTAIGLERPIEHLSGGQRAKVILKEHVTWLADYLSGMENAFLVVSHDYDFLEKISTGICDIDQEKITKYYGTYWEYTKKKELLCEEYIRKYSAQQRNIKKTEEFIRKNIAGRKSKMARGRQKQLDRLDELEALEQKIIKPEFRFDTVPLTATEHLKLKHLCVGPMLIRHLLLKMSESVLPGVV